MRVTLTPWLRPLALGVSLSAAAWTSARAQVGEGAGGGTGGGAFGLEALPLLGLAALALGGLALAGLGWLSAWLICRRRASAEARAAEVLRHGFESVSDGLAIYDAEDRLVTFNPSYLENLGLRADEVRPGRSFTELTHLLLERKLIDQAVGHEAEWLAARLERHDGASSSFEHHLNGRWLEVREVKQPNGYTALIQIDISARKVAEAELRESEQRYRDLIEGSVQGFCIHRGGKVLLANQEMAEIFGYDSPAKVIALRSVFDLVAKDDREAVMTKAAARMAGEPVAQQYSYRGRRKDGSTIWVYASARLINWEGERAIQFSVIDLTELKLAQEALLRSEERYRGVVEDQTELICRALPDGTLTFVNSAYCRFFGGSPEHWVGRSYLDTLSPEERRREVAHLESLVENPRIVSLERQSLNASGQSRWLEWTDRLLTFDGGVEVQSVAHDVTDTRAVEDALLQSEQRYRKVVDDQTELIRRFRPDTVLTFVNEAYCRYFGMRRDELLGRPFLELLPAEERESVRAHLLRIAGSDEAITHEARVSGPAGESRWLQWTDRAFKDARGKVIEFQSVGRDVTARRVIEERFRAFIDNAPAAISIKDREGRYVLVNRQFAELIDREPAWILGQRSGDLFPADFARSGREHDAQVLATGRASVREEDLVNALGRVNLLTVKFPLLDDPGEVGLVAAIHTDITPLKRAEEELEIAKEEAEKASAAKTRFLAAASHDLRQPLHAMRLLLDTLGMSLGPARQEEVIAQISNALSSMSLMLNALLDVSELESGAVRTKVVDFRIDSELESLVATLRPSAEQKGLEVRLVPCSAIVRSDSALLSRILDNFLSNAVRYTDAGRILVGCRKAGRSLRIEIWDSGHGIPPDSLESVFEDYRQLGNPSRDRSQGLGLGLGIARRLARLLGHEVTVRSWPDRGSVFTVEVPLGSRETLEEEVAAEARAVLRAGPSCVLVIEDDPLVAQAARLLLSAWGIAVQEAGDARGALEQLRDVTVLPEVIIADYRLPDGQTGLSVIEEIRSRYDPELPAIVVTGDISPDILREAEAAGCEVLRKPVEPGKLRSLLRACTAGLRPPGEAAGGAGAAGGTLGRVSAPPA